MSENDQIDEERFYENLDQWRELIQEKNDVDPGNAKAGAYEYNEDEAESYEYGEGLSGDEQYDSANDDEELMAVFSDYGESDNEYDQQDFMDAIREANNFKVKKSSKKQSRGQGLSKLRQRAIDPEVAQLLSEANEAFVRNDIQVAEQLYNEVIKKDAKNFAAYKTLGDIYHLQGRYNDCCNSWFLAAHLNPSDWEFWKMVATLSSELKHIRQAVYCYSRAISMNPQEWECIYSRAMLYKDTGQLGRSLEGFQRLYKHSPYDSNILRELAVLYVEYGRVQDAIMLYMKVFENNVARREAIIAAAENVVESSEDEASDDEGDDYADEVEVEDDEEAQYYPNVNLKKINKKYRCVLFDWSALNILAELFLKQSSENQGIKMIKTCARWIQHREQQSFWDDVQDDSEFDDRRFKNSRYQSLPSYEKSKDHNLPIDIRVRLGLLRLNNKHIIEAMNQFQFLYSENFADIADLYFEVAVNLTKMDKFQEAIEFFVPLLEIPEYQTPDLYKPLSKCYREVEDYENAKEIFTKLVELMPEDLETKLTLAEIHYHLGEHDTFDRILLEVVEARKKQAAAATDSSAEAHKLTNHQTEQKPLEERQKSLLGTGKPLLQDIGINRSNIRRRRTPQDIEREKKEREKKITLSVLDKYGKLKIYRQGLEQHDKNQTTLWIDTASDLIDIFSSVKNFFVKSRSKKFVGIIKRTRKFNKVIDYRIERLSKLSEGDNLLDGLPLLEERVILTSTTELRGLTYDKWFELFMELALNITKYQSVEDGLSIIETAQQVNVFVQDPARVKVMKFVKLAIVLHLDDEEELVENLRGLLNQFQFGRKPLQVFMYSLSSGQMSLDILSSTVQQKFFLRQLKAFDSIRFSQHVSGQASVTNKAVSNPAKKNSPYLHYIYATLLYSSKGFMSALQYLSRMDPELSEDPMVNFLMGLCYIHRSMQRLTGTRHFQILQGFRCLYNYHRIRSTKYTELERQEADYNIGRSFHLLGLFSNAVKYYDKVLNDYDDVMLKKHAAYNLVLIYNESGNPELAGHIMDKYLSI
ncbi:AFR663Wp [Eremothecium gossypii ATCC 10895]|uniref:AFR663Wp n=1 Tax=Eremothecium gossypii (strain ATCC 10895 / CBS 109.51 / FGSC 9923 / NRRL Y-1056) TaxID=284811 RepID=Q752B2_EREGS|nr:AFR663Wp [Eremothecium gossypii ATCC 10895]AAS54035.2 AFR663Wp [Eremothecium gossypii ATCC 10895]AEY98350.1 FAFR663Wp [Eremothecium gossypii FDAG1]